MSALLLGVIASQGVAINSSVWYLNYSILLVIVLVCAAMAVSLISKPISHSFCELVFLAIYTPTSQALSLTVNIRDVYEDEATGNERLAKKQNSSTHKQFFMSAALISGSHGLTLESIVYVVMVTTVYKLLSTQLKQMRGEQSPNSYKLQSQLSTDSYLLLGGLFALIAADFCLMTSIAAGNLVFFLISDIQIQAIVRSAVQNQNIEIMEGLEEYYTVGLLQLAELSFTLVACYLFSSASLILLPLVYFSVYQPISLFQEQSRRIRSESLCLSNFEIATQHDLDNYDDVCAICLSGMSHARVTPCKHIFHGKCLKDCLRKKAQCPMCNAQVL